MSNVYNWIRVELEHGKEKREININKRILFLYDSIRAGYLKQGIIQMDNIYQMDNIVVVQNCVK
jgi:hypothetical protein